MREYLKKALRRLAAFGGDFIGSRAHCRHAVGQRGRSKKRASYLRFERRAVALSVLRALRFFRALGAVRLSRKISPKARAGSFRPARERGRGGVHELCRGLPRRRGNDRRAIFRRTHLAERRTENDPVLRQRGSGVCYRRSRRGYARERSGGSHNFCVAHPCEPRARRADAIHPAWRNRCAHRPGYFHSAALPRADRSGRRWDKKYDLNMRVDSYVRLRRPVYSAATPAGLGEFASQLHARSHRRMRLGSRGVQHSSHSGGARLGRSERTLPDNAAHKDLRDAAAVFFLRAPWSAPLSPRCSARDCSACSLVP